MGQLSDLPENMVITACDPAMANDSYDLGQVSLAGDVLVVPVSFGGGCGTHTFTACWDHIVLDSFPPMVHLAVQQDAHGDTCDAWLTRELRVELAPILHAAGPRLSLTVIGAHSQLAGTTGTVQVGN